MDGEMMQAEIDVALTRCEPHFMRLPCTAGQVRVLIFASLEGTGGTDRPRVSRSSRT